MKTIRQFIHRLFGGRHRPEPESPAGAAPETPSELPDRSARQPEHSAFTDDDSPPGNKIRWHG